jgi:hypothetical protein
VANIKLNDLLENSTVAADLFKDSDSFIRDLSICELALQGGQCHVSTAEMVRLRLLYRLH